MEEFYNFVRSDAKEHSCDMNIDIIGVSKFNSKELVVPDTLRYFKNPDISIYPMILEKAEYTSRHPAVRANKNRILEHFLSYSYIEAEIKAKTSKKFQIYTQRSVLVKLLLGSNNKFPFTILVSRLDDKLFMTMQDDERDTTRSSKEYWVFVQHLFTDHPNGDIDLKKHVNEDEQYYCLFKSQIGNFDLIYSGEVTGVNAEKPVENMQDPAELNSLKFVLTKTVHRRVRQNEWEQYYINWWSQAYLAKVNDVYVGLKSKTNGQISVREKIRHFKVDEICETSKWKKERLLGGLLHFLNFLQSKMSDVNSAYTTYELEYDTISKVMKYQIHDGKTKYSFLSQEFIDACNCL